MKCNTDIIMPGDVYEYTCNNEQGYGYMIPVKTSYGWDLIDTYQLENPSLKPGETLDEASIRRIIELGSNENDGYVKRATSDFYFHNVCLEREEVPDGFQLLLNLNDYDIATLRECEKYDGSDVILHVPLYREQHFHWRSGKTLGLCFVKKNAKKNPCNELTNLVRECFSSITPSYAGIALFHFDKIKEKLNELENLGLATQAHRVSVSCLEKRIEIINKCNEDLKKVNKEYLDLIKPEEKGQ
jgi:hypothetical protein